MDHRPLPLTSLASASGGSEEEIRAQWNALLNRIEEVEPRIKALAVGPDGAPAESASDRRKRVELELDALFTAYPDASSPSEHARTEAAGRPPLFAVPLGVKDIFSADGFATRAGSRLPPDLFDGPEATSVSRLRKAGAIVLGKTVTTEFAYFAPGPTANPWNLSHTPGGSSSGSAAAVSAGYAAMALGTQTIGSVNRPASFCGIVGFKPTYGRVPIDGVVPCAASADTVGLLAADVSTARAGAAVLVGDWNAEAVSTGSQHHLLLANDAYTAQADTEIRSAIAELAERLGDGWDVEQAGIFSSIDLLNEVHRQMVAREFAEVHRQWMSTHRDLYAPQSLELAAAGGAVSDEELQTAIAGRAELRAQLDSMMHEAGVLAVLTPSAPGAAPHGLDATGSPLLNLPWTYAGMPTVTLPAALARHGLPLGVQLVGRSGTDEALLELAAELEAAIGFAARYPAR